MEFLPDLFSRCVRLPSGLQRQAFQSFTKSDSSELHIHFTRGRHKSCMVRETSLLISLFKSWVLKEIGFAMRGSDTRVRSRVGGFLQWLVNRIGRLIAGLIIKKHQDSDSYISAIHPSLFKREFNTISIPPLFGFRLRFFVKVAALSLYAPRCLFSKPIGCVDQRENAIFSHQHSYGPASSSGGPSLPDSG